MTEVLPRDAVNAALVANVRPPGWANPTPASRYNLVVIGAGTAGLVAAAGAAILGARVALVERHRLGGDCLNTGCVPSKAVIRSARAAADTAASPSFGVVPAPGAHADFAAVMDRMRRLRARISAHDSVGRMRDFGVDVFLAEARFSARDTVEVGGTPLRFKKAVIATGARPAIPAIEGLREAGFQTNETIFSLVERPARLAVIGGGPIGCELAQAFRRLGSEVVLLDHGPRVLKREDPEVAGLLQRVLRREGIRLMLGATVRRVVTDGGAKTLEIESRDGRTTVTVDEILVGAGRAPNVEGIGLEAAGVAYDGRTGVHVDDRLQTTNARIYAAGDVAMREKFTHTADAAARIVIRNALFLGRAKVSALTVPWCTYTDPEIAHVGMAEQEARRRGIAVETFVQDLKEVDRAIVDGEDEGFAKVVVKKGTDRILGGIIVARHAGDMINELTLAMVGGLGLKTIATVIHPYPTQAEAMRQIADAYFRRRLTPVLKRVTRTWLSWTR